MNDGQVNLWQTHLAQTESALMHFVPEGLLEVDSIREAADEIGFAVFVIDAERFYSAHSLRDAYAVELALMDVFAESMNFPSYFGRNWNALLDMIRDLSWTEAKGYALIILESNNLPSMPEGLFSTLIEVLEATVRNWRDERGEFNERTGPVAFHVIFSGGEALKESLLNELREPFCEHTGQFSARIFPAPVRLRKTSVYRDAEQLASAGADAELLLSFLREHGMDERDSMYSIAGLTRKTMSEAKSLMYNSQTWPEIRHRDEHFRKLAQDTLRKLNEEDS